MKWRAAEQSLARHVTGADRWLAVGVLLVAVLHVTAIFLPAMQVERLLFFSDTVSIWKTIAVLFKRGEWLIAPLLALFTIIFPLVKLGAILHFFYSPLTARHVMQRHLTRLEVLGRWSMLDVMVAALLVVSLTATKLADARFLPGMYLFALSVVCTLLLSRRITLLAARFAPADDPDQ